MTTPFRRAAYQAVERAKAAGMGLDDQVVVQASPGSWRFTLRELKALLHQDQRARKRERKESRERAVA